MALDPHPIIPQSPEQARQRDHLHGRHVPIPENAVSELARLRNAIRAHRQAMENAGPLGVEADFTPEQVQIITASLARKHAADHALWAHLPQ